MHYGFQVRNLVLSVIGIVFIMFMVNNCIEPDSPVINKDPPTTVIIAPSQTPQPDVRYETCKDAPGVILQEEPGYRIKLDRDNDGIACE